MNSISPSPFPPFSQDLKSVHKTSDLGGNALTAPVTPDKRTLVIDKTKVDPQTLKAAEGMEAMFLNFMMDAMRKTVPKEEMDLENTGTDVYRNMLDNEVSQKAAHAGGVGLADQIVAYLESQRYNSIQGQGVPNSPAGQAPAQRSTGGSREGQPIRK